MLQPNKSRPFGKLKTCLREAALARQRTLFGEQVGEGRAKSYY